MKTKLGHLQFNVDAANVGFYKELTGFLGWDVLYEGDGTVGVSDGGATSLWFNSPAAAAQNDYDGPGMNHIGFETETPADVDTTVGFLRERGVELLFGTPCRRPEYEGDGHMYYSAMFESPDKILFEIVYSGPATA